MTYACIHSQHADYEYTLLNINMYYKRTLVIIVSKPAMNYDCDCSSRILCC